LFVHARSQRHACAADMSAAAGGGAAVREQRHVIGPAGHADAVEVVTLEARSSRRMR
jgi:hypothetical protein